MGVNIRLAFQIDKKKPNNNYDGQDCFLCFTFIDIASKLPTAIGIIKFFNNI